MNTSKKIILVPVDFSETSMTALHHAEVITRAVGGELFVLHVLDEPGAITNFFSDVNMDEICAKAWEKMAELEKQFAVRALNITTMVSKGKVYEEVANVSELIGASFIVMGTNGTEGIVKRFIGSNALRVVRESHVPVITIKGEPAHDGFKNIVLPLDLSKETREKVNKAIELSRQFDATIHVVSVLLTDDEEVVAKLEAQLNQVEKFLEKAEVKHTSEIIHGRAKDAELPLEILNYTAKVQGDLIMIMTQQETEISERFIGSAAQDIINNSRIPVCSIIPNSKLNKAVFTPY